VAGLQAIGLANSPYAGPVALDLSRLAQAMGQVDQARRNLLNSHRSCEELHELPYLALTRAEPAKADGFMSARVASTPRGLRIARQLGMRSLVTELKACCPPLPDLSRSSPIGSGRSPVWWPLA